MNKQKISYSVPATIYEFGETKQSLSPNKFVTQAKLKIFYVGKTGDRRVFTKDFSDKLLKTLPHTPVVAYYNEEKEDFKGHNVVQYVFGFVPDNATIEYVEEDNKKFAVTDVLLFTGRQDNIGFVANKIIGRQHSLELDPKTVEYNMTMVNGKIEKVVFTEGSFIGLSVLGDGEKPAFAGSEFFTENDAAETFINSFKEFQEELELYTSGGDAMHENNSLPTPQSYQDFMTATLTEKIESIVTVLSNNGKYGYFIDEMDGKYIFRVYDEDGMGFYRIGFSENTILSMEKVFPRYLTETEIEKAMSFKEDEEVTEEEKEEVAAAETIEDESSVSVAVEDDEEKDEDDIEEKEDDEDDEEFTTTAEVIDTPDNTIVVTANVIEGLEDDTKETKEKESETSSYSAALNDAERQELNEYRQTAKIQLIESYKELDDSVRQSFIKKCEQFTLGDLEKELAVEYVKLSRSTKSAKQTGFSVFSMSDTPTPTTGRDKLTELVERYKDKK